MRGERKAGAPAATCHLLSVDVDDLVIANADFFGEPLAPGYTSDIEREVSAALSLLDDCGVRATFFVNAQYCKRYPGIARQIATRGHRLASHGFRHRNIAKLTLDEFEEDLGRSLELLALAQDDIIGYRPPAFSMPYDAEHLRILARHGIRYVSSGVAVARANTPRADMPRRLEAGLLHVPISTAQFLGGRVKYAVGYGIVARLMPQWLYLLTLRRWLRRHPFLHLYCHSFELGGLQSGLKIPLRSRAARLTTRVYALRCRGRGDYLKKILTSARFQSIEAGLFSGATTGAQRPARPKERR